MLETARHFGGRVATVCAFLTVGPFRGLLIVGGL